jgi:Transcriptional regulator
MDTRYLQFFVQAGKSKSLVKAAKQLHISQQGLSAAIIRLEAELKCKLLVRTRKGITLTREGEAFLPRAQRILEILEECDQLFSVTRGIRPLRLVCAYGVLGILHEGLLDDFREENPDIDLDIAEFPDLECEKALRAGDADVGLLTGPIDPDEFDAAFLFKHGISLIMHHSHHLADSNKIAVEQLRDESLVCLNKNFRMHHRLTERCREAGFEPRIVHHAAEIASVHKLAARRYGIGLTVDLILQDMPHKDLVMVPLEPAMIWDVHTVTSCTTPFSDAAASFVSHVAKRYKRPEKTRGINVHGKTMAEIGRNP